MEDFCLAYEDRRVGEDLRMLIKGSGAFRRFKDAINSKGADKAWYQFRRMEFERIAIEWLDEAGIPYTREDPTEVSHQRCDAFLQTGQYRNAVASAPTRLNTSVQ